MAHESVSEDMGEDICGNRDTEAKAYGVHIMANGLSVLHTRTTPDTVLNAHWGEKASIKRINQDNGAHFHFHVSLKCG